MMIALLVIGYILIGIIIGVVSFVFIMNEEEDGEALGVAIGIFWPIIILGYVIFKLLEFLICNVYNICVYIHDDGIHYYKGELSDCCGKCKYIEYCNNHNDINTCKFSDRARPKCISEPCNKFKKHLFWRFTIRLKNK
jgi:hypothetical protein